MIRRFVTDAKLKGVGELNAFGVDAFFYDVKKKLKKP